MNCCLVEFERKKKRSSPHVYAAWTNAGRVVSIRTIADSHQPTPLAIMFDRARLSVGDEFRSGVKVIRCYYATANNNIADPNGAQYLRIVVYFRMIRETAVWGKTEKYEYYSSPVIPLQKTKQLQGRSCIMLREYIWLGCVLCVDWKHSHFLLDRVNSSFQKRWHCSSFFYSTSVGVSVLSFGHWVVAHYSYKSVGLFHLVLYIYRTSATK